ncbi:MAG: type II/IV secretion system protein [Candidatus Kerfeldbacteria bacterium]|nr:type II/IV secretion system protein [Candidatus Kerfeldbacteria bacterium]
MNPTFQEKFSERLLDLLREQKALTETQVQEVSAEMAEKNVDALSLLKEKALVREEEIAKAIATMYKLPYVDLFGQIVGAQILKTIPEESARTYQMVCFKRDASMMDVAIVDPGNLKAIDAAEFIARKYSLKVRYHVVSSSGLAYVLKQYGSMVERVQEVLRDVEKDQGPEVGVLDEEVSDETIRNAPVSKMVSVILRHAVDGKASDVHIEPMEDETRVRFRMDGVLHTSIILPKQVHPAIVARIKVLANLKIDETRLPQDGRFRMKVEDRYVDYRVSTMPLVGREKVVLRILDKSTELKDLEELGFMGRSLVVMRQNATKPTGMFLSTGPTGSGKSTTLYTMLSHVNSEKVNIITLEDPVEHFIAGVNQSQVKPEIGLTFAKGLRSILRQDPDIVMVGEIRDSETAELAIHAALTGHVVFSTLHTNDALGAIPRLIDMGIEPFLIVSALNVIVAQRLLRRICEHCKTEKPISPSLEKQLRIELEPYGDEMKTYGVDGKSSFTMFKGKGCSRCEGTGYRGRLVIAEVMELIPEMKKIVDAGANPQEMEKLFHAKHWLTLKADGLLKALLGLTTFEEVLNATKE